MVQLLTGKFMSVLHIDNEKESAISRAKELSVGRILYVIEANWAYYVDTDSYLQPWDNLVAIVEKGEIKHLK